MMTFEMLGLETRDLVLHALAFLAAVLGWHLGTTVSVSALNPSWLGKGFWKKYIPSLPSNKWEDEVISIAQPILILGLVAFALYWVFMLLHEAISILALLVTVSLPDLITGFWLVGFVENDFVFVLIPIAMFTHTFLTSTLNIHLLNLRYSQAARLAGAEDEIIEITPK